MRRDCIIAPVMLKGAFIAANPYLIDSVGADTAPYSNAFERSMFYKTSFQCKGKKLILQVSDMPTPDESTEDDWVEPGGTASGEALVWTEVPARWMRVKGVEAGDTVFVSSTHTFR